MPANKIVWERMTSGSAGDTTGDRTQYPHNSTHVPGTTKISFPDTSQSPETGIQRNRHRTGSPYAPVQTYLRMHIRLRSPRVTFDLKHSTLKIALAQEV